MCHTCRLILLQKTKKERSTLYMYLGTYVLLIVYTTTLCMYVVHWDKYDPKSRSSSITWRHKCKGSECPLHTSSLAVQPKISRPWRGIKRRRHALPTNYVHRYVLGREGVGKEIARKKVNAPPAITSWCIYAAIFDVSFSSMKDILTHSLPVYFMVHSSVSLSSSRRIKRELCMCQTISRADATERDGRHVNG